MRYSDTNRERANNRVYINGVRLWGWFTLLEAEEKIESIAQGDYKDFMYDIKEDVNKK